jgi:archaellum biogenesis protein FlaJ (TadC family)
MMEFLTAIIALCALAMFVLSAVIHQSSKRNQQQMEKLIKAAATSILISGRTVGEPDTAVRLFNEQYPLFARNLKFREE